MDLVKEAISVTLKTVRDGSDLWLNPEKGILTRFVNEGQALRKQILLIEGEVPVFEYSSEDCYSLITSIRVISIRKNVDAEKKLVDIKTVRPLFTNDPFEDQGQIKILRVIDFEENEFLIEFDEGTPAYFAIILIDNLSYQLKYSRWFLNPSDK